MQLFAQEVLLSVVDRPRDARLHVVEILLNHSTSRKVVRNRDEQGACNFLLVFLLLNYVYDFIVIIIIIIIVTVSILSVLTSSVISDSSSD